MAISSSLSTALSGLQAHQTAIKVTSNNIANASNPDYVRERPVFEAVKGINSIPGDIGLGVKISTVDRITDTFLFNRFAAASSDYKKLSTMEQYVNEIGNYFPDVQNEGLYQNLKDFFDAWQTFASNPNDGSVKVTLAQKTISLSDTFHQLATKLTDIQKNINQEINSRVTEANDILKQIAELNSEINAHEANHISHANELRDKRDALEKRLKELIGAKVYKTGVSSYDAQGAEGVDYAQNYQITLGGYPLVDGSNYYPLKVVDNKGNYDIAVQKEDFTDVDVTKSVQGEIGGLLYVRGYDFNDDGTPKDGVIGDMLSSLNALAQGMIRSVNSIYSYSAQNSISTDPITTPISITPDLAQKPLSLIQKDLKHPVRDGKLALNIYDNNGNLTDTVSIDINTNQSIDQIVNNINNALAGKTDTKAVIKEGEIKFVTPEGKESPNVLVKDDGSNLFSALNEIEYVPLSQINTTELPIPLENGSFDVVTYDDNGNVLAKRTITVDMNSTDPKYSTLEGIVSQINTPNIDDNQDNNPNDDVDDLYNAKFIDGKFIMTPNEDNIYVGLDNDTANFGGALGVNKFFDGNNAFNIKLRDDLAQNPSNIHAYKAPNQGNNEVANEILQLQFQNIDFYKNGEKQSNTIYGFYSDTTTKLADEAKTISDKKETAHTLLTSISNEYYSISGVNLDDQLIALEKYQRGYQANARVITTINQMLDALFNIKQ